MAKLRDQLVILGLLSAAEAYILLHYAPQYKPTGGLGRLTERFLIVNTVLLFAYRIIIYPFLLTPLRSLPGPPGGNFLTGNIRAQFSKPPGAIILKWVDSIPNDGLLYYRGIFNRATVIPTTHETLKAVLSDHTYDYEKPSAIVTILRRILGDGLILVEGNVHKFQRKHLTPSFQLRHIRELYPMFWSKACEMTTMLAPEKPSETFELEFGEWCMRTTLDIIGIAGFGRDFGSLKNPNDELVQQYSMILEPDNEKFMWFVSSILFPQWIINNLPWHLNRELTKIQKNLNEFALNMVKSRRAEFANEKSEGTTAVKTTSDDTSTSGRNDILSLLVRSNDFTNEELSEQVLTMMAAGHETTSSALSWCTFLLSKHPDIQKRVRDEVRTALPSPDSGLPINAAQIDSLTWLNAVCLEVVRLYPTVPLTSREVVNETPLASHMLPKGTQVLLVPWAINRSRAFWGEDAAEFKPERWINPDGSTNKNGGSSSNYAQLTFLHGPRSCIGQGFAQSELKCLLAAFVGRYEFELSKDAAEYFPAGLVTTKPVGGMWLRMKAVEGW